MDYTGLVSTLQNLLVIPVGDTSFAQILPSIINDAEGRIYREMDFLAVREVDGTLSFTPNSRNITIPSNMIIVEGLSAITPAATAPASGTRNVLERVSLDYIDFTWPQQVGTGATGVPVNFTMLDDTTAIVSPTPAAAYRAEFTGIFLPEFISSTNLEDYISVNYPDLLVAACMVFGSGYLRDWGPMANDPQTGISWEGVYQSRKQSVMEQAQRQKSQGNGWTPYSATPNASPPRTG